MTDTGVLSRWGRGPLPGWVWLVLLVSLALNVLVAGTALGNRWRGEESRQARLWQDDGTAAPSGALARLAPEKRQEMRRIFEAHRGEYRGLWQAVRARREEVLRALQRDPFDKAAYVTAMRALIEAEAKARSETQPMFADIAATLSAEERREFLRSHRQLRRQIMSPRN